MNEEELTYHRRIRDLAFIGGVMVGILIGAILAIGAAGLSGCL